MNLGPAELVIVLLIALLLFGGKKLPDLARSLGEAQKEFRRGTEEATTADAGSPPAGAVTDAGPSPVGTTDQPPTAVEPSTDGAPPTDRMAGEPTATNAPTDPSADG